MMIMVGEHIGAFRTVDGDLMEIPMKLMRLNEPSAGLIKGDFVR